MAPIRDMEKKKDIWSENYRKKEKNSENQVIGCELKNSLNEDRKKLLKIAVSKKFFCNY